MTKGKKQLYFSAFYIVFSLFFALTLYAIITTHFKENPIIVCDPSAPFSKGCLVKYAGEVGIKKAQFISCYDSNKYEASIEIDKQLATYLGVAVAPSMFAGVSDNNEFYGFYTGVETYEELATVIDDIQSNGVVAAQKDWYKVITDKVDKNVKAYLTASGYTGAKFDEEYAKLQPQISDYLKSFALTRFAVDDQIAQGTGSVQLVYFVDFASSETQAYAEQFLAPLAQNYIADNSIKLIIKDLPVANVGGDSKLVANAARCANEQGQYFKYFDILNSINLASN
jgi:protein-disulfide isomerase